jgi:two-component system, OmpR family, KDP operon response regulator KdpE
MSCKPVKETHQKVDAMTHRDGILSTELERILVLSRDISKRSHLLQTLEAMRFDVGESTDGKSALLSLQRVGYEAILMECATFGAEDVMACCQLRSTHPRLPILVVSTYNSLDCKVVAFEAGVDDFLVLPLHERELAARLHSAVRRFRAPSAGVTERFTGGGIVLDLATHRVEKSGSEVSLAPTEFRVLELLMQQAGRAVSHSALAAMLWGQETAANRKHLRVIIGNLRRKIEDDPSHPRYLFTHAYFGYRFHI